jgi:hypothetical protein
VLADALSVALLVDPRLACDSAQALVGHLAAEYGEIGPGRSADEKALWHQWVPGLRDESMQLARPRPIIAMALTERRSFPLLSRASVERVKGIEPSSLGWEPRALPLSYTRSVWETLSGTHVFPGGDGTSRAGGWTITRFRVQQSSQPPSLMPPVLDMSAMRCHEARMPATVGRDPPAGSPLP